jgi:2-C-methyl-D-erythritol 4-phosphate cytidylyltransferase
MTILRCGGATRRDSVRNGLAYLADQLDAHDWVLVHDAARPGLTSALLQKLIDQVGSHAVGGLLALPVVDTVKRVIDGKVETVSAMVYGWRRRRRCSVMQCSAMRSIRRSR